MSGSKGKTQICNELQVYENTFKIWLIKFETQGTKDLLQISKNTHYPETLKLQAIADYNSGKISQEQICKEYSISSATIFRMWIKKYNSHERFKSHNAGGDRIMTKGRKTTYEERTEIVAFCITNNEIYQLSADKFQVS